MTTEKLAKRLEALARAYGEAHGAKDIYCYDDRNNYYCRVTDEALATEFVYTLRGTEALPVSTLSCRVYLEPDTPYHYELQELIDYLDIFDFHCYCFPYIENEKRLEACFTYLTDFLEYHREELVSLCAEAETLKQKKLAEIKRVYGYDEEGVYKDAASQDMFFGNIFQHYSAFLVRRYSVEDAYTDYILNRFTASLEKYGAMTERTGYEDKLVRFLEERYAPYQAVTPECASVIEVRQYRESAGWRFALLVAASVGLFCFGFFFLQLLVNAFYLHATRFAYCANPFVSALCGVIPGAVCAVTFRKRLEPLVWKNKKQAAQFLELLGDSRREKTGTVLGAVAIAVGAVMFLTICKPSLAVFEDRIDFRKTSGILTESNSYAFEDFEDVILVEGRYLDKNYTEYEEDPYYIFLFSGRRIISSEDLKMNEKELKELINLLDPGMENYKMRSIPAIEDLV